MCDHSTFLKYAMLRLQFGGKSGDGFVTQHSPCVIREHRSMKA